MKFEAEINGLDVRAEYTDRSVKEIFLPLLAHLHELQERKGGRAIVFLAAPPAAGKSTLAAFLHSLDPELTVLGMDGFHRRQEYLLSHTTVRDGAEIPMVRIKGAPETFDLPKLTEYLRRAASGEEFGWPVYNRLLHNPVEDAARVQGDLLLVEGNYLLLGLPGWKELRQYADYTVSITADPELLRGRLTARKRDSGAPREEAEAFVSFSDLPNARLCLAHSLPADLPLVLRESGEYEIL